MDVLINYNNTYKTKKKALQVSGEKSWLKIQQSSSEEIVQF